LRIEIAGGGGRYGNQTKEGISTVHVYWKKSEASPDVQGDGLEQMVLHHVLLKRRGVMPSFLDVCFFLNTDHSILAFALLYMMCVLDKRRG
jgi:hypothetical protein